VTGTGKARAGFSLTEILMAVGILGIGMSMVASVFPVAVDQSRLSTEMTMASLSARSVAAILRARRQDAVRYCRSNTMNTAGGGAVTPMTARFGTTVLPYEISSYNPFGFLYDEDDQPQGGEDAPRQYSSTTTGMYGPWSMGSYVPVVFATPISRDPNQPGHGPWRITILIFKSRGERPDYLNESPSNWVWIQNRGEVGTYIMDWRFDRGTGQARPNNRGEAYKVQRHIAMTTTDIVVPSVAFAEDSSLQFRAFVAGRDQNEKDNGVLCYNPTNSIPGEWVSLPGAVAAYHTILGD